MVSSVALLSLLGAAALAGVNSAPVAKDDHIEEMVTRCIVEVLLNGLSKPNAPTIIDPMCRELLKKSNQRKQEEKNVDKDLDLGTRQLSESEESEKSPGRSVKEEQDLNEEELKRQTGGAQKRDPVEGKHEENSNPQLLSQESPHSYDEAHKGEKKDDNEKRSEEEDSSTRNNHGEEGSIEKKHNEKVEHELLDKKSFSTTEKEPESDYKHSGSQRHSEESAHTQGKQASKEEEDGEEEEEESSEKYHHSLHREYEDSFEREDGEVEKRGHNSRHSHRKPRLGNSSEYKSRRNGEKENSPEESSEEESEYWGKRSHYPKHHHYETGPHYEKRNSHEMQDSEEMEGKSRSKEYQDRWRYTEEDDEDMRHHSMESEEKQPHYERKRPHVESEKEMRHHYEERKPHSKTSEEGVGRQHHNGRRDDKRHQHEEERQRLEWEETPKPQSTEREEEEENLYSLEVGPREEKRHDIGAATEEEPIKRHHSEGQKHGSNKRTLLVEEGYPRSHYLVENVKRAATSFIPFYQHLRWKNRHADKKDDIGDSFWESAEEPRSPLNERDFFPEYNDYDSWEKKQLLGNLNPKHNEHSLERMPKFDTKRQYNRMDELAHLLNYRKKSAEFPELYDSKEDVKRGHGLRSGKGKLSQRPLTQQEEKELENLAAMDLELQKIAEKFSNNQRG
ncbi:hypothetical protein lerEdw1_019306 [Lerista edwardsae]|nr:hypothetical protein lerEdw1_019306 [Lerista edwardsae]